jgi:hypothetical protein
MQFADVLAIVLVLGAGGAFLGGERALSHAEDVRAIYWLVVGMASLYASVQVAKPGARA